MKTLKTKLSSLLFFTLLTACTFNASLRNLEVDLVKGDQNSSPSEFQKIFVDITSVTITEGSVAIINVAVNPVQATDTVINLNLTTSGGSYIRFNPIPTQIIIPAGSTSKSVVLNTIDDSLLQDQETWSFSISSPDPNLHADPGVLNVTLKDNDGGAIPGAPVVSGARLLKEINPYPAAANKIALNGNIIYVGTDATHGSELWITDGSQQGTHLVKDLEPGGGSSSISSFYHPPLSPYVFFTATTSSEGTELWVSDGTDQGTYMISNGFEPGSLSSNVQVALTHKDKVYFVAQTTIDGRELYVTDGTNAGTKMLIELATGTQGITDYSMFADGDDVYFSLLGTAVYEAYIYKTNGTPAGTSVLVTADSAGNPMSDGEINIDFVHNGIIYFRYFDWNYGYEMFVSGQTNATTKLLKDIYSGFSSSYASASSRTILNGKVFISVSFDNSGATTGYYLSDGTTAGTAKVTQSVSVSSGLLRVLGGNKLVFNGCTNNYDCEPYISSGVNGDAVMLKDINPGTTGGNANSSSPIFAAQIGNQIFFTANSTSEGTELWVTDGTPAGTVLLKDIYPGSASSSPSNFLVMGSRLIFTAKSSLYGDELWVSDGTPAGTVIYTDLIPGTTGSGPSNLAALDTSRVFFTAYNNLSNFASVFVTDTSTYTTTSLPHAMTESLDTMTKGFVEYNSLVYFDARESGSGSPLWVTNGTQGGTVKIKDLFPASTCSDINYLTVSGSSIFFSATTEANGLELHVSDGTTAGTNVLKDLNGTSSGSSIASVTPTDGGKVYFAGTQDISAYGIELFVTNGTTAGTTMVKDLNPGSNNSVIQGILALAGTSKVIVQTYDPKGFWISDGTSAGTVMLSGLPSMNSIYPAAAANNGAYLYFNEPSINKLRIYFADAATGNTTHLNTSFETDVVKDSPMLNPNSKILYYTAVNGTTYSLWKTDGTVAGTTLLSNIPFVGNNYTLLPVGHVGSKSFFEYRNNTAAPYVRQLWVSDGTPAGTSVVDTATNTEMINYGNGYAFNGYLYFTRYHATAGQELWKTDGTSANTMMVKDINPGLGSSSFSALGVYNGKLYFSADDGVHGRELWRTDGTSLGTELVADINPGSGGSSPSLAKVLAGKLYFSAYKVLSGREVWVYSE